MTPADSPALDFIDLQLTRLLRRDPRTPYADLASQVGRSRTATRARVQRLLDFGAVRITSVPHPRTRGLHIAAELLVDTSLPAGRVAAALGERSYLRAGLADGLITLSLWCSNDEDLIGLTDRLHALPEVRGVEVFRVANLLHGFPAFQAVRLDELDRRLMDLLAAEPRARYSHLGDRIGLSHSAARARVQRLLASGSMIFEVDVRTGLPTVVSRISLTVQAPVLYVARRLLDVEGLTYLAAGHGRHDLLARLTTPSGKQHALYQRLRNMPGVSAVQIRQLTCEDDLPALRNHSPESS